MKITYNKNPLYTTIELNKNEKKELWYKIKITQMEDLLSNANFYLENSDLFNLENAKKSVNFEYYISENKEKPPIDKRTDILLEHYVYELQKSHCGDCTCVAYSCGKCIAENLLEIDTILGLPKHSANNIESAFGKENQHTIEEAIENLSNYKIDPENYQTDGWKKIGGHEQYIDRWIQEAKVAHDWLVIYKKTKLN